MPAVVFDCLESGARPIVRSRSQEQQHALRFAGITGDPELRAGVREIAPDRGFRRNLKPHLLYPARSARPASTRVHDQTGFERTRLAVLSDAYALDAALFPNEP